MVLEQIANLSVVNSAYGFKSRSLRLNIGKGEKENAERKMY